MTLISMLLALIVERLAVRSDAWQSRRYCQAYLRFSHSSFLARLMQHRVGAYLWLVLPGAIVTLLLCLINSWLVTTLVNALVLLLGIGCWHYRKLYKQYLNALDREDEEAAHLTMQQIRHESGSTLEQSTQGQLLVWINFRYYAAVVFWFLIAGAFGVITYVLVRQLQEPATFDAENMAEVTAAYQPDAERKDAVHHIAHWADWFPARLFGLGFALVGHFSRASAALLGYFLDFTASNEKVVTEVAAAAEPLPEGLLNTQDETSYMVQLAKRNILFFLAFTAILTLSGWLR
ncbi:regulatory signaling modulator protein AmpE [Chromatiaceae bacterium AAb-1]|nr:regulatory signaling modulator protein AmpE [Chromatiaceae bacterium AAb-1]